MRSTPLYASALAAILMLFGFATAHAANGLFYDPSNVDSQSGYTTGYKLFRTIGCPGRELLGKPCDVPDSDHDGVPDFRDKCPGTPAGVKVDEVGCPLPEAQPEPVAAPAPVPAPARAPLVLEGVNFDFDKAVIRPPDVARLEQDFATLKKWGDVKVEVAGHTDSIGTEEYNMGLSLRRANAVRNWLVGKGVAADRLIVKGYGETMPIADNKTAEGRFKNRRVELVPQE
ncbi:MAG: OmpA family protein [Hyphomicrobiaceae bacterium]